MEKIDIAIGTASKYKLNAILKALHELDIEFNYSSGAVGSEISEQPCKKDETKLGSANRARNILKKFPNSDIGLGVEFGYEPEEENGVKIYRMVCWASIITKDGEIFCEQSSTLQLPREYVEALKQGVEVNNVLDKLIDNLPNTEASRKLADFIYKRRVIYECVENVMLRYLFRGFY